MKLLNKILCALFGHKHYDFTVKVGPATHTTAKCKRCDHSEYCGVTEYQMGYKGLKNISLEARFGYYGEIITTPPRLY